MKEHLRRSVAVLAVAGLVLLGAGVARADTGGSSPSPAATATGSTAEPAPTASPSEPQQPPADPSRDPGPSPDPSQAPSQPPADPSGDPSQDPSSDPSGEPPGDPPDSPQGDPADDPSATDATDDAATPTDPTQPDEPGEPFFNVGDDTVVPSQRFFVAGGGCEPGATAAVRGGGAHLGDFTADDAGAFAGNVDVPRHWVPGDHHDVSASCGGTTVGSATVTVIHEPRPVLNVDTTRVPASSGTVFFSGRGCEPGATGTAVDLSEVDDPVLVRFTVDADGGFFAQFNVPDQWEPGDRRFVGFTCGDRTLGHATFEVFADDRFFDIDDPRTSPGGELRLTGKHCEPGTDVTLTSDSAVLATVTADGTGGFDHQIAAPDDWEHGETHAVTATCADGTVLGTDTVTIARGWPRLFVGDPTVLPGQEVFVETSSCPDGSTLVVRSDRDVLGAIPQRDVFNTGVVRIPDDWEPGTRTIGGVCGDTTLPPVTVSVLPAGSQELPFVEFGDDPVLPGQQVSVRGGGCRPGDVAELDSLRAGEPVGRFPVDEDGRFSGTIGISPDITRPGEFQYLVTCGQDVVAFATLGVTVPGGPAGGPAGDGDGDRDGAGAGAGEDGALQGEQLPFTGATTLPLLLGLGLALVAGGTALTLRRGRDGPDAASPPGELTVPVDGPVAGRDPPAPRRDRLVSAARVP